MQVAPLTTGSGKQTGPVAGELSVVRVGTVPYGEALELQRTLRDARIAGAIGDTLLLLQHPPVYTRGRRASADELRRDGRWYEDRGIEIADVERGGRTTYHAPGQLVGYPIVDLSKLGISVPGFVSILEDSIIDALAQHDIDAAGNPDLRGAWVAGRKIGSIGIHVSRGVTTHGFAVNVDCDLTPFTWISPCGIDAQVTSIAVETGQTGQLRCFSKRVAYAFSQRTGLRQRLVSRHRHTAQLAERLAYAQ